MSAAAPAPAAVSAAVQSALAGVPCEVSLGRDGTTVVVLAREHVREALARLSERAGYDQNTFITAIDHLIDEAELATPRPRYEVSWQLLCSARVERVRVKTRVTEDDARVPTCIDLWPGAAYAERECFDMYGIRFDGHANLKRLLMPEGYDHHPLRKDFPHEGIEPDKLYRTWDRERRAAEAGPKA
jgi:NADH-quinone oxidoreductase subunit C